jgi:hypothetical protein
MKKTDRRKLAEGHLDRYDWAKGRRGAFAKKAAKASELLRILEPELAEHFPDSKSVNEELHALLALDQALPRRKGRRHAAA